MSHLKTSAISCAVQPTANSPAQMAPALLPAKRLMFFNMPQSSNAYVPHIRYDAEQNKHSLFNLSLFAYVLGFDLPVASAVEEK